MSKASERVKRWRKKNRKLCPDCNVKMIAPYSITCRLCASARKTSIGRNSTLEEAQNHLSTKGKHPSWINAHVRNYCRNWNKVLTTLPCANCGYKKHVELCHIRAVSDFPLTALLGEINSPNNIIQLCPNCHWEFDHNLLSIEKIKEIL